MRTLGNFHIDERRSFTELRSILTGFLSEGLIKATTRAKKEAEEAAAVARTAKAAADKVAADVGDSGTVDDAGAAGKAAGEFAEIGKRMSSPDRGLYS